MNDFKKYSADQLRLAVNESGSLHQVALKLKLSVNKKAYVVLRRRINELDLDTSHFIDGRHISIQEYFNNTIRISSHNLRLRLLSEGIFEHKCYRCSLKKWQGQPMPLELNHINGDHFDNRLENLEILCPNCHALTTHYKGRGNKGRTKQYCKRHHPRNPENVYKSGGCKLCKQEYDARLRIERRARP